MTTGSEDSGSASVGVAGRERELLTDLQLAAAEEVHTADLTDDLAGSASGAMLLAIDQRVSPGMTVTVSTETAGASAPEAIALPR